MLLPPSEGKAEPRRGRPLELGTLAFADDLGPARKAALDALADLCAGDPARARAVLELTEGQAAGLARNIRLYTAATVPAGRLYTGVLYDELDLGALPAAARRRAARNVLIASGLWGVLRPGDRVPAYRLSGASTLPPIGPLAAFWRGPLGEVLPGWVGRRLLLDLRSGTYAAAWRPRGDLAERTVTVRVVDGGRVVSHSNKATKGRLARALLCADADPGTPRALGELVAAAGFRAELAAPVRPGRPWELIVEAASGG